MKARWSLPAALLSVGALAAAGTVTSIIVRDTGAHPTVTAHSASAGPTAPATSSRAAPVATTHTDPIAADIVKQQVEVRQTPGNYTAWASLGLDYVQQAKVTVNPSYYPKAEGVLARSLKINTSANYVAMAGMAALKAAEHDFTAARTWAQRGLKINPYNATLYGSLNDADTQLGRYQEASVAVRKMNTLQPGVPSFTRVEYMFELRGDIPHARQALARALGDATAPADKAFVYYYLAELAFNNGDPAGSLAQCEAGLRAAPTYAALRQGKARAEAALGRVDAAVGDYTQVVDAVPQPEYVVEFGDYLQSLGRTRQAEEQYRLFDTENKLFEANGVTLDTDPTLFYANHGKPKLALKYGQIGIRIRPFIEMQDAYAWALHANGRDEEALVRVNRAMQLGTRNALFYYHAGMIEMSLGHPRPAKTYLTKALAINPHFNPLFAPAARAALAKL